MSTDGAADDDSPRDALGEPADPLLVDECDAIRLLVGVGYRPQALEFILDRHETGIGRHARGECGHEANRVEPVEVGG